MQHSDPDTLLFFDDHPDALELYQAFENLLYSAFPNVSKRVQKTQITFSNRHVFACVSFARVKRKPELPKGYMVITLGLPAPLDSERVAVRTDGRTILLSANRKNSTGNCFHGSVTLIPLRKQRSAGHDLRMLFR